MKKLTSVIAIMLIAILALGVFTSCEPAETPAEKIYFAKDGASEYSVVYSNDGVIHESAASRLYQAFALEMLIPAEMYEDSAKSNAKEILFGKTDRALSVELAAAVDAAVAGDNKYAYGYGYKDGKLAFYATDAKAIEYSLVEFLKVLRTEDEALCCMSDLWVVKGISDADYDAYLETKVPYYITYSTDGGIITSEAPLTYNYGTGVDLPTSVKKDEFVFKGWYANSDFRGPVITSIPKEYQADLTVYAKWERVVGHVTYELGGGAVNEGAELPATWEYGKTLTLVNDVSKLGSIFDGWYDNAEFEGSPVTSISADVKEFVTLYAKWNKVAGLITYVTDGGKIVGDYDLLKNDGQAVTLPAKVDRAHHVFLGWYDNAEFEGDAITELPAAGIDDYTIYAKYDGPVRKIENEKATNYVWGSDPHGANGTYDLGSAMIAAGTTKATIKIDTASTGSSGWTAGYFRLRPGQLGTSANNKNGNQTNIINFAEGKMKTLNGVVLTELNTGDVVDIVIDFSIKTIYYYVNGVLKATETSANFNTDLLCYDYVTNTSGYSTVRGNFIQLSAFGSGVLQCDFMGLYVGEWITAPAAAE